MPKLLFISAVGASDPTRATFAFHFAVNGAREAGADAIVALVGEAVEVLKPGVADSLQGMGVPAMRQLLDACKERGVRIYVWTACAEARAVSKADVDALNASYMKPPDLVRMSLDADRVLTF